MFSIENYVLCSALVEKRMLKGGHPEESHWKKFRKNVNLMVLNNVKEGIWN